MKSPSTAINRESARVRFSPPIAVAGIVLAFFLLLVMLLPNKALQEMFAKEGKSSPALIRYLEAALKKNPDDQLVRIRLAESLVDTGEPRRAIPLLVNLHQDSDDLGPRRMKARYRALVAVLCSDRSINAEYRTAFLREFDITLVRLLSKEATTSEMRQYAYDARRVGAATTAEALEKRLGVARQAEGGASSEPGETAETALGHGNYRESARLCFDAMPNTGDIKERRALFIQGLKTLQSGNFLAEALASADLNIDDLDRDRETLLFLTRLSLAAGDLGRAQRYIKKSLGMSGTLNSGGKG
jgi:hypothetical protein